jgi:hypothetical protein
MIVVNLPKTVQVLGTCPAVYRNKGVNAAALTTSDEICRLFYPYFVVQYIGGYHINTLHIHS